MTGRVAGIRPPPTSPLWDGGRLRFADAGTLPLSPGDWVVVDGADAEGHAGAGDAWVGEVVVAPEQIVEAASLGTLARVARLAEPDERPPARTEGAGLTLLRSLGLPDAATHATRTNPASRES